MKIGPNPIDDNSFDFIVWSPLAENLSIKILGDDQRVVPLQKENYDFWCGTANNIMHGTRYMLRVNDDIEIPDPASNFQPEDVNGPSEVVNHNFFKWSDNDFKGIPINEYIIYEVHIGTFTPAGTFEAAITKLDYLIELGITAIEIMPVSQFPGERNWGYDGVFPFAPQHSYGGPEGLKRLVDECHKRELAVILDVVYNHFGPEGNYSSILAPFFNSKYKSTWGDALNFDGEYSDGVRNFFLENAVHWLINYHIDSLRIDAANEIYDLTAIHFLNELSERVNELSAKDNRLHFLIAEWDVNDSKVIKPIEFGGFGFHAQWNDDFHHTLHANLTGENEGYYVDFNKIEHIIAALKNGYVYSGKYSVYRKRRHGNDPAGRRFSQFVNFIQNHDQVGNRAWGERLSRLVDYEALKLAAGVLLLSPFTPMLFMGEEYMEKNPFLYFINHHNPELIKAVQTGRREEFSKFNWIENIPNPNSEETFNESKLNWDALLEDEHAVMLKLYKHLILLRKSIPAVTKSELNNLEVIRLGGRRVIIMRRWLNQGEKVLMIMNFESNVVTSLIDIPEGKWEKILDTSSKVWNGPGCSAPDELIAGQQNITLKNFNLVFYKSE